MTEWRQIPGARVGFEVSDDGQVRGPRGPRRLGSNKGYPQVSVPLVDGTWKRFCVHTLVLLAFVGPKPKRAFQACHADNTRDNNRVENLRWDLPANNYADRRKTPWLYDGKRRIA